MMSKIATCSINANLYAQTSDGQTDYDLLCILLCVQYLRQNISRKHMYFGFFCNPAHRCRHKNYLQQVRMTIEPRTRVLMRNNPSHNNKIQFLKLDNGNDVSNYKIFDEKVKLGPYQFKIWTRFHIRGSMKIMPSHANNIWVLLIRHKYGGKAPCGKMVYGI